MAFNSDSNKNLQEPMENDFSSADEDDMIMEVEKNERSNAHTDFSSADEDGSRIRTGGKKEIFL